MFISILNINTVVRLKFGFQALHADLSIPYNIRIYSHDPCNIPITHDSIYNMPILIIFIYWDCAELPFGYTDCLLLDVEFTNVEIFMSSPWCRARLMPIRVYTYPSRVIESKKPNTLTKKNIST